jgi:FtsP/CotA-like multicopper oxidase with cupredoxin domain
MWLTNAANTRTFNVSFTNARMKLVASDMSAFSSDVWVESVVVAPAERYAVDVRFESEGQAALVNRVRAIDHLFGQFLPEVDTLALYDVGGEVASDAVGERYSELIGRVALTTEIGEAVASAARLDERVLMFGLETRGLPFVSERMMLMDSSYFNPVEWSGTMPMMNWATESRQAHWFVQDGVTGARNDSISLKFRVGDRAKLRLVNLRGALHAMQHPIHVHGQRFLVLSVNGVEPETRAWKDTVLLPAGAAVDILVQFDNPGRWMLHCHIAEHVESGMMTTFEVEER